MAPGKKSKGLGIGLDAMFGDVEINLEPEVKEKRRSIRIKKKKTKQRAEVSHI